MKLTTIHIFIFCLITTYSFSQKYSLEYGKISSSDFKYVSPTNPDADAVVLYDIGDSKFIRTDQGYNIQFIRKTKIKINSRAGIDMAEIEIPFYKETNRIEKIVSLKATTYNIENGILKKSELNQDNIFEERVNENWYVKKFAMPNVKEGSVVEYTYTIETPFKFNLRDWEFQSTVPIAYSKYKVGMIPFYEYVYILQGASKFDDFKSYVSKGSERQFGSINFKDVIYEFTMKDVEAFEDVDFITSKNDFLTKIDFQLAVIHQPTGAKIEVMTTWPKLIDELNKHSDFGKFINKSKKHFEKQVLASSYENLNVEERITFGVNYVKNNFKWDGYYSKYASKEFKEFIREQSGNAGNINLFLTGVLQAMELDANPLILSTRKNGKVLTDYPISKFFNYIIVAINDNGTYYMSDATERLNPSTRIPVKCINDKGLIIKEDKELWVNLNPAFPSLTNKIMEMTIEKEKLNIDYQLSAKEYSGLYYRKNYSDDIDKLKEYVRKKGIELNSEIITKNVTDSDKPYVLNFKGNTIVEKFDGKIYITPFLKEPIQENPFTQKKRKYPIDFIYPKSNLITTTFTIPENHKIESLPESFKASNDLVEINYSCIKSGENKIIIQGLYNFKLGVYPPEDYNKLKFYYQQIIKYFNQQLVIVENT